MLGNPDYSAIFAPKGLLLREGDLIRRTNYSNTLFTIAQHGPSAFYKGPIADALISKIRSSGGILTHADLEGYKVKVNKALEGTYFGRKVYTAYAPASGPVILQMFNLMEHYGTLREDGRTGVNVHRLVEAMKCKLLHCVVIALLIRCTNTSRICRSVWDSTSQTFLKSLCHDSTKICDPAFSSDKTTIHNIPTKEYANLIAPNITDNRTHPPEYYNPEYSVHADHGTSHNSIIDKDGMAVAITTSVNMVFGAFVLDPVTGVIFDDTVSQLSPTLLYPIDISTWRWMISQTLGFQMLGESTPRLVCIFRKFHPVVHLIYINCADNYPEPHKRPLSSMAPLIMEHADGSLYLAAGGSGGSRIFGAIFQTVLNLDWGLDASQAVEFGRVHDQLYPTELEIDEIYPPELIKQLAQRGHNITSMLNTCCIVFRSVIDICRLVREMDRIAAVVNIVTRQPDGCIFGELLMYSVYLASVYDLSTNSCKRFQKEWYSHRILTASSISRSRCLIVDHHCYQLIFLAFKRCASRSDINYWSNDRESSLDLGYPCSNGDHWYRARWPF
jgi:gamma-glutamyltranspeptidase / glutathione hydrolase / leukotriene-C4 hydrolase